MHVSGDIAVGWWASKSLFEQNNNNKKSGINSYHKQRVNLYQKKLNRLDIQIPKKQCVRGRKTNILNPNAVNLEEST